MSASRPQFPQLRDADWLRRAYVEDRRSTPDIAAELGCTHPAVRAALRRHGIPTRPAGSKGVPAADYARWRDAGGVAARRPIGPDEHKAAAAELGVRAADLLALTQSSDPFYCGRDAQRRDAEWFANLWGACGGVGHIRRLHYRLVSETEPVLLPGGEPFQNTEPHYLRLCDASAAARHLGLVDARTFVDRRNPNPHLYASARAFAVSEPGVFLPEPEYGPRWRLPELHAWGMTVGSFTLPTPGVLGYDYDSDDQPVLIEVWIEKSTMNDVLMPVCRELGANLVPAAGMQSITNVVRLLERCQRHAKPGHVIYISDFDPGGQVMPTAVARELEFYGQRDFPDVEITVDHVALTHEQVLAERLPRTPIKDTDPRRRGFEDRHGAGATELDALEALRPGMLAQLVRRAAEAYRDPGLRKRLASSYEDAHERAMQQWQKATADLRRDRDALREQAESAVVPLRERYEALRDDVDRALAPLRDHLADLEDRLNERFEQFEPELPERPSPARPPAEGERDVLFDSRRGWLDQLARYRRNGRADGEETAS